MISGPTSREVSNHLGEGKDLLEGTMHLSTRVAPEADSWHNRVVTVSASCSMP